MCATFVEGVEADDFYLEVAVEGHLPEDVIAEGSLACCRPSSHSDDDLLDGFLNEALLAGM